MILERLNSSFSLKFNENSFVSLKIEWVDMLRQLPFEEYGPILKETIYPGLSPEEKIIWNKSFTSNKDLFSAIQGSSTFTVVNPRSPSSVEGPLPMHTPSSVEGSEEEI